MRRFTPSRRFAGLGAKAPLSATKRATANPYGITLDRVWTERAAQHGVSETMAAALCLISRNRKVGEVVVKNAKNLQLKQWAVTDPQGGCLTFC
jgi:hypothetical protein